MLLRQTLLYLPAQLIGPAFQFLSVVVWTHWLSPGDLGLFALIIAAHELMHVGIAWFSFYTLRYVGGSHAAVPAVRELYLRTEASILATSWILAALATLLLSLTLRGTRLDPALAVMSILFMATRSLTLHLADRARAEGNIPAYSVLQIVTSSFGLLIGLAAAHWISASCLMAIAGLTIAQLIALALVLPRLAPMAIFWRPDRATLRPALRYGLPFIVGGALVWTTANAIRYMVDAWQGAAAVGLMTVGWVIGQRGATVAAMLTTAASFPLAVRRTREEGHATGADQLARNGVLLLLVLAPAMAGLCAVGSQLTRTLVAAEYQAQTIAIIPWSVLAGFARNIRVHFANQIFLLRERSDVALLVDAIDAIISLVLCALGLWLGGVVGAVIGAAAGAAIGLMVSAGLGRLRYGLVLPWAGIARIALATLAMVAVVLILPSRPGALFLLARIGAGAAVYALAIGWLFPEAQDAIRNIGTRLGRLRDRL